VDNAHQTALSELACWDRSPDPSAFPYDAVVAAFRGVGKHFVGPDLLDELDRIRARVPEGCPVHSVLGRFLSTALDKFDGRYDNPSYLALEQLGLPGSDGCPDSGPALHERDRLTALLLADVVRHELEHAPVERVTVKRCRHALRTALPALGRLGIEVEVDDDPIVTAERMRDAVLSAATPAELRKLQLTALPVSLVHDEYMFIRALQSYETTFALIGVQLGVAVAALARGDGEGAAAMLGQAESVLAESSAFWSLTGTMRTESFLTFREFTDGASAIQSRSYKRMESRCRRPDAERLDSAAYAEVPEVRERVIAGQPNIDSALDHAIEAGLLTPEGHSAVSAAMSSFEAAVFKWRKTHHSIAVRMLGERRGTGGSAGTAYLDSVREIPLFAGSCPFSASARSDDAELAGSHPGL
jgi:tryptophan 2,3-dioxygenase